MGYFDDTRQQATTPATGHASFARIELPKIVDEYIERAAETSSCAQLGLASQAPAARDHAVTVGVWPIWFEAGEGGYRTPGCSYYVDRQGEFYVSRDGTSVRPDDRANVLQRMAGPSFGFDRDYRLSIIMGYLRHLLEG